MPAHGKSGARTIINNNSPSPSEKKLAEEVGFEPTRRLSPPTIFPVSPDRPLLHSSKFISFIYKYYINLSQNVFPNKKVEEIERFLFINSNISHVKT